MNKGDKNINPGFKRFPFKVYSNEECLRGLQEQNAGIVSYLISKSESHLDSDKAFLAELISNVKDSGHSRKVAISGSPGVGKSTLINSFVKYLVSQNKKIAILPVDPSSQISKGSILGDKTRMEDIVKSEAVFIKPMPSSFSLGGVSPGSYMAVQLCALASYDYIIIETVGVGQSEFEAKNLSDMFVLLLQPGGGDELQGIKRGIMEMADLLVINKADGTLLKNAQLSMEAYRQSMKLMLANKFSWKPKVQSYSSMEGSKYVEMYEQINTYFDFMSKEDRIETLRQEQSLRFFKERLKQIVLQKTLQDISVKEKIESLQNEVMSSAISPFTALQELGKII